MAVHLLEYLTLRKHLQMSRERLQDFQLRKIRETIDYAYRHTEFYHHSMKEKGVYPDDIKKVSDLSKLSIITKEDVQKTPLEKLLGRDVTSTMIKRTTSGSTGNPLKVYLDPEAEFHDNIEWTRSLIRNGMSIRDKMAVISDPRYFPEKRLIENFKIIHRKYISIFEKSESQVNQLIKYDPDIIRGYPSNLEIMIRENPSLLGKVSPKTIFTSGELLDHETRDSISNSFNCEVYDYYVCNEFSQLAWECNQHTGYHINADSKYIEIVKDGESVAPGETGEIVVTRMGNPLMPLIRYKIGDVGKKMEDECSCGVSFPLLEMVEGRTDDLLLTTEGKIVTPLIFFPYPFEDFEGIMQFRVIQENRYKIVIELVADDNFITCNESLEGARKAIKNVFGETMEVEFSFVDEIKPEPSGKIRKIISKVKMSR